MTTYHYILASRRFLLEEEPFPEVLAERHRNYAEQNKEIDFWLIEQPAFVEGLPAEQVNCPRPAAAVVSTDATFITWLKLRLEYVITGSFEAPSETIPDPLASLVA
ncbi:MAG: MgPME-cyclase complex family protein [Cyanobacteria bacterium P01_H01_bin.15]